MRRLSATAIVTAMLVLGACSSGHKKASSTTTTQPGESVSTTMPSSTGSAGSTSTTARNSSTTTRPGGGSSNVTITAFDYVGDSPVRCNAPTQAELKWTTSGATNVRLSLDGALLAQFPNGSHDELFALPCDGNSHTYELKATAPGVEATRSLTISTKQT